jgi:hypothetical protein
MKPYLGAVLVIVWAVLVAWSYLRRPRPPVAWAEPYAEPEWDTYQAAILR